MRYVCCVYMCMCVEKSELKLLDLTTAVQTNHGQDITRYFRLVVNERISR